jgi:hypothetical protein
MAEARRQRLPGAEFMHQRHRMYFDEQNRVYAALELIKQAQLSIFDAYWIRNFAILQQASTCQDTAKNRTLDDLKIGAGIELCLKATLVYRGFIVHKLRENSNTTNALSIDQKTRPISVDELLAIEGFQFNGAQCLLPALLPKSIDFQSLLKVKYKMASSLSERDVLLAEVFKDRRNMIHLPNDEPEDPDKLYMSNLTFDDMAEFIEKHIIRQSEVIAERVSNDNIRRLWRSQVADWRVELQRLRERSV